MLGLAWHYKKYQHEQPADERARYSVAEDVARTKRVGLWQEASPEAPGEYRHRKKSKAILTIKASRSEK